uniref:Uncharacterized protein LOC111119136 n=1 Tax=Crassostrea virginica TaxID=6565 RepID=A0A8B8CG67_CRAVI|nr:uncharacterized protein LOC111119136 [Crassostrea virginica]
MTVRILKIRFNGTKKSVPNKIRLEGKVHSWWELVYKVVTGAPFGAHALLINNGTRNTNNLAAQQLTNQVLDHYKSDVMDDMHINSVTKIRVSYYLGGVEVKYFVFDAVGATKTDWFSRSRLLETNYDITALTTAVGKSGEYFSIAGDTVSGGGALKRHFYVNEGYYGCEGDQGWVLVVDGPGPCLMDQVSTTTVYFVNTASFSLTPGVTADFMAVFVERGICSGTSPAPSSTTVPSNGYLLINETEKLEKKITEIKTNLTVPVNTTSQYLRDKVGAFIRVIYHINQAVLQYVSSQRPSGKVHSWWELVYKVVTGAPFGAHALLINNGTRNTNNLAAQQLTNQVLDHYKSDVMDDMHTNGVTKIRVSYYLGGIEVKYFVFDAVGATKTDWFSRSRLLETNYDITALTTAVGKSGEYFSIAGDTVSAVAIKRHFYINEGYYGCENDQGWVLVVDGPGPCLMDQV